MGSKYLLFTLLFLGLFHAKILFVLSHATANLTTLRVVQILFRHGARNIDETYPTDPYIDESYWNPGYSQLTNVGKLQGYNLGLYLRERYKGFVKETYDVKETYVLSSDISRTMETAYSVMAGFYLPNELSGVNLTDEAIVKSKIEVPLPWKSVPVHTIPIPFDNIVRQKPSICPKYNKLLSDLKEDQNEEIYKEGEWAYEYLSKYTGQNITNAVDYGLAMDPISVENYFNFTLPTWTAPLLNLSLSGAAYFRQLTKTFEMKRLRVGPLLQRLTQNMVVDETGMNRFQKSRDGQKKMYFFSGHDETIGGLLNTLEVFFDRKRPTFTSAVFVELHQNIDTSEYYIEFYYRNETDREPYKLEIPNCSPYCSHSNFLTLVEKFIPSDWNRECQLVEEDSSISGVWIALTIAFVWIILFIALQCWIRDWKCFSKKRQRRNSYTYLK